MSGPLKSRNFTGTGTGKAKCLSFADPNIGSATDCENLSKDLAANIENMKEDFRLEKGKFFNNGTNTGGFNR
jgi:hypothetical protein